MKKQKMQQGSARIGSSAESVNGSGGKGKPSVIRKVISNVLAVALVATLSPLAPTGVALAEDGGAEASALPQARAALNRYPYGTEAYWESVEGRALNYTTLSSGQTLTTGTYYIKGNQAANNGARGGHGLIISGNVTLRFVDNAFLTASGGIGSAEKAGGAGIYLPSKAKLTVEGTGSLVATGGSGGMASDGEPGADATNDPEQKPDGSPRTWDVFLGSGGAGGAGAGAPGTGIGGASADGGTGGAGGEGYSAYNYVAASKKGLNADRSNAGTAAGTFVTKGNIQVQASAGSRTTAGGKSGAAGQAVDSTYYLGYGLYLYRGTTGGGGGGGGGAAGAATSIGSGASGGAGGGGGASGSMQSPSRYNAPYYLGASGGGGGALGGKGGKGSPVLSIPGASSTMKERLLWPGVDGETSYDALTAAKGGVTEGNWENHLDSFPRTYGGDGGIRVAALSGGTVYSTTLSGVQGSSLDDGTANSAQRYRVYPADECEVTFLDADSFESDGTAVYRYTGKQIIPEIQVKHVPTGTVLVGGAAADYVRSVASNINGGTASLVLTGTGLDTAKPTLGNKEGTDSGSLTVPFKIKYDLGSLTVAWRNALSTDPPTYRHTGSGVGDAYLVTATGIEVPASVYSVRYEGNVNPGVETARAKISVPAASAALWTDAFATKDAAFSICKAPTILSDTVYHDATVGIAYSLRLAGEGSTPYTWSLAGGQLPDGLSLSKDGRISGVPTRMGTFTAFVRVSNMAGTDEKTFTWHINDLTGITWHDRNRNGVMDPGEEPIPGVKVTAYQAGTAAVVGEYTTDAEGRYMFSNLSSQGIVAVDLTFTSPDEGRCRVVGSASEKGVVLNGMTTARVNRGFLKAVDITLDAGSHGRFPGDRTTKLISGFPGDIMIIGRPNDLAVEDEWRVEGWYHDSALQYKFNNICPDSSMTLYANYDNRTYKVEYIAGDGVDLIPTKETDFVETNLLPDPAPVRDGYVLARWVLENNPSRTVTNDDAYGSLVDNIDVMTVTLVAIWEYRSDIKVTLDANGSTGAPATINGRQTEVHENLTFDAIFDYSPPVREGYSFIGWSEKKAYDPETDPIPTMSLKVPFDDAVYYAAWEAKDIGVIFDATGGGFPEGEDGMRNGLPGEEYSLPAAPTRLGYTFTGWYETPAGSIRKYAPDDRQGNLPLSKTYYYAQWEPSIVQVTLEAEGGTPDAQTLTGAYGTTVGYTIPARSGYVFLGWEVDGDDTYFLSYPEQDASYRAVWAIGSSSVAFNPMGGTFADGDNGIRQGNFRDPYSLPVEPVRPGHVFEGWYTSPEYLAPAPTDGLIPAQSETYYAKWGLADITVDLYVDGVLFESPTGKYRAIITYSVPSREGASFMGWKLPGADDATASMYPTFGAESGVRYDAVFKEGVVSVVYHMQGGEVAGEGGLRSGFAGEDYTIPADPMKTGYTFEGWYDAPVAGALVHMPGQTTAQFPDKSNTVYYAQYRATQIEVTLEAGDEAIPSNQHHTGVYGEKIPYDQPVRDGYTFLGWKRAGGVDSSAVKNLSFPSENTTYQAVWAKNSIELRFEAMGGTLSGGDTRSGVPRDAFTLPTVDYVGYAFEGWYDKAVGGTLMFGPEAVDATFPSASATCFARWVPLAVGVTLDAGADAHPQTQDVTGLFGEVIPYTLPIKEGSAFMGWKLPDAPDADARMFPLFTEASGVRYVAVWAAGKSSIAYDPMGGSFAEGENGGRTGGVGEGYQPPADPIRTGYVFSGWYTEPDGRGTRYTETTFPSASNTTVYAKWTTRQSEVSLDSNYEGSPAVEKLQGPRGESVLYNMPSREGFAFLGWSTTADGSSANTTYFLFFADEAMTYYAQWAPDAVSVRYHPVEGAFTGDESGMRVGTVGGGFAPPGDPQREGYAFAGWFTDIPDGNEAPDDGVFPVASTTYYAHWEAQNIEVALDLNHPDSGAPEMVRGTYLETIAYTFPERAGFAFAGWSHDAAALTGDMHPVFPAASGMTLYAVWVPQMITATFDPMMGVFEAGSIAKHAGFPGDAYDAPLVARGNFIFKGWFTTPLGATAAEVGVIPNQNTIYYAQWEQADVEVTFQLSGGTVDDSEDDVKMVGKADTLIEWREPVRVGWIFAGWKKAGEGDDSATMFVRYPGEDATYAAVWAPAEERTVAYNALGGEVDGPSVYSGIPGTSYQAPSVKPRTGYAFLGWATRASDDAADHQAGEGRTIPADSERTVYYALWAAQELRVTLEFEDGSTPSLERMGHIDEPIDYFAELPVREGFVFKGWGDEPDALVYDLFPVHSMENADGTLYAQWDASKLMVSFFESLGTGADIVFEGKPGTSYTVPQDPSRIGYRFMGWYSDRNGVGDKLDKAAGETVPFEGGMQAAWYAAWEESPITVTLDANGGLVEGQPSVQKTGRFPNHVHYEEPVREGYVFAGWQTTDDITTVPAFPLTDGATYVAQWDAREVTLQFDALEGAFAGSETGMREGSVDSEYAVPPDPVREGYSFGGWFIDTKATTPAPITGVLPIDNTTYYAKWVPHRVTVQLSAPGSNAELQTCTGSYGDIVSCVVPTKPGSTFVGWTDRATGATNRHLTYPLADTVYDAQFITGSVIVTFDANEGSFAQTADGVDPGLRGGDAGDTAIAPAAESVVRAGYAFQGWFNAPVGGLKIAEGSGAFIVPHLSTVYYAQWAPVGLSYQLDPQNGGSPQMVEGYQGAPVRYAVPAWAGRTFMGWATTQDDALDDATMFLTFDESSSGATYYGTWATGVAKVSFDALEGSPSSDFTLTVGESFTVPADPVRAGYTFDGWYDAPDGGTRQDFTAGQTITVASEGNSAYYARYQRKDDITVVLEAGNDATPPTQTLTGTYGDAVTYAEPVRNGYAFKGWKLRVTPARPDSSAATDLVFSAQDTVYDAVWRLRDITYTFDANGGILQGDPARTGVTDDAFTLPQVTRDGHTFKGWFTMPQGGSLAYGPARTDAVFGLSNTTYYAQWIASDSSALLDANGGAFADLSTTKEYFGKYDEAVAYEVPIRTDHSFVGWAPSASGTLADAQADIVFLEPGKQHYAVWANDEAAVIFRTEGGTFIDSDETGVRIGLVGSSLGAIPALAQRDGYTFGGWFASPDGQGAPIAENPVFEQVGTRMYYAFWVAGSTEAVLDANGGEFLQSGLAERSFTGTPGTAISYGEVPARPGYGFMGWSVDSASAAGTTHPVFANRDTRLFAIWKAQAVTLDFQPMGGTLSSGSPESVVTGDTGETYTVPSVERKGYTFKRWWSTPTGVNAGPSTPGLPGEVCELPSGNATYYAQWTAKAHTTALDANGGYFADADDTRNVTGIQDGLVTILSGYEEPVNPGFAFVGWSTTVDDAAGDVTRYPRVDVDTTVLYAIWSANTVTVTYHPTAGIGGRSVTQAARSFYAADLDNEPTRTGYDFTGWFADPMKTDAAPHPAPDGGGNYTMPNEDMTWFAQWEPMQVSLTLDADGGHFPTDDSATRGYTGAFGDPVDYEQPVRAGYLFKGWDASASYSITFPSAEGMAFKALWEPTAEVVVSYEMEGGRNDNGGSTLFQGRTGSFYSATDVVVPGRDGYAFAGWFSRPGGQGTPHPAVDGNGNHTFPEASSIWYAAWNVIPQRVMLDPAGGTMDGDANPRETVGPIGSAIAYTLPVRDSHTFIGWNEDPLATSGDIFPVYDNDLDGGTLTAIWKPDAVSAAFFASGGSFANTEDALQIGAVGDTYSVPADPNRAGYRFDGWYLDSELLQPANIHAGETIAYPSDVASIGYWARWSREEVTLTLDAHGGLVDGNATASVTGYPGDAASYVIPVRPGYTFAGWDRDETATSGAYAITIPATADTYFAIWKANDIKVTFDAFKGSIAGDSEFIGEVGAPYTVPMPERPGYTFLGWATKVYANIYDGPTAGTVSSIPSEGIVYFAQWEQDEVTVTMKLNGGTIGGSESDIIKVGFVDERILYDTPTMPDYVFMGWRSGTDGDENAEMYITYPAQDATLYAVWKHGSLQSAVYHAVGGTLIGSSTYDDARSSRYSAPSAEAPVGYRFAGWTADPDSGIIDHRAGDSKAFGPNPTQYYYAVYLSRSDLKLTLHPNGGFLDGSADAKVLRNLNVGDEVNYRTPVRDGYTFAGWALAADATHGSTMLTVPTTDSTWYAVWAPGDKGRLVYAVYHGNGGRVSGETLHSGNIGDTYAAPSVEEREGHRFIGWSRIAQSNDIDHGPGDVLTFGMRFQTDYHACWQIKTDVVLRFNVNGGTWDGSAVDDEVRINQTYGTPIEAPIPQRAGYLFMGWSTDPSAQMGHLNMTVPASDAIYYAAWMDASSPVGEKGYAFYDGAGGTVVGDTVIEGVGGSEYAAPSATRVGYAFIGWSGTPDGAIDHGAAANKTLVEGEWVRYWAVWRVLSNITITLDPAGGTLIGSNVLSNQAYGSVIMPETPVREGFQFIGWKPDDGAGAATSLISIGAEDASYTAAWLELPDAADTASVYYDACGGAALPAPAVNGPMGDGYTSPSATRPGYTFLGWSTSPNGSIDHAGGSACVFPNQVATTYYALWERLANITITAKPENGGGDAVYTGLIAGDIFYPTAPSNGSHVFVGWVQQGGSGQPSTAIVVPQADATYVAVWREMHAPADMRIVMFFTQGGVLTQGAASIITGGEGTSYTIPGVENRPGYEFAGWSMGATLYQPGDVLALDSVLQKAFYATWNAIPVEVTLLAPDSDIGEQAFVGMYGTAVPYSTPYIPGVVFKGWKLLGSEDFSAQRDLLFPQEGGTYIAVWDAAGDVDVIYDLGGGIDADGSGAAIVKTGKPGLPYRAPAGLYREGHVFRGWYEKPAGQGALHPVPDEEGMLSFPLTDTIWYAAWDAVSMETTLDGNGGSVSGQDAVSFQGIIGTPITYDIPERPGYVFLGWSLLADATEGDVAPVLEPSFDGEAIYAIWRGNAASALFLPNGGTGGVASSGAVGDRYEVPADPSRIGYRFTGWYDAAAGGTRIDISAGDTLTYADVAATVYWAHWSQEVVDVTLDGNGGAMRDAVKRGTYGESLNYEAPEREGYTFRGWSDDEHARSGMLSLRFPAESCTYYAVWDANAITVVFDPNGGSLTGQGEFHGAYSDRYIAPEDPVREGYSFRGWATRIAGSADYEIGSFPSRNIVYYALWDSNSAAITPTNPDGQGAFGSDADGVDGTSSEGLVDGTSGIGEDAGSGTDVKRKGKGSSLGFELALALVGGQILVRDGESDNSQVFLLAPDPGYRVAGVRIDGTEIEVDTEGYLFAEVEGEHLVDARFVLDGLTLLGSFEMAARFNPFLWVAAGGALLVVAAAAAFGTARYVRRRRTSESPQAPGNDDEGGRR